MSVSGHVAFNFESSRRFGISEKRVSCQVARHMAFSTRLDMGLKYNKLLTISYALDFENI